MQTEPIITTNNMSVDDVAAWITEKPRLFTNCNHSVPNAKEQSAITNVLWTALMKTLPSGKTAVL